jgi:glutathione synthase/RimK-type ligase-like ATP-grasp enzyme
MTTLILGHVADDHAIHVLRRLRDRGQDAELLDSNDYPTRLGLFYDPARRGGALRLPGGRRLNLDHVRSVYWRSYGGIGAAELPDPGQAALAANDARGLFESLLIGLRARWVNGWNAFLLHQTKPEQLARVAALGVPVPATLLSNDPDSVQAFAAWHPRCVFKPVQGGAHTRRLGPGHLAKEHLRNLAFAPVTIQEEIPGTDVRVFVAGQRVLACEVRTGHVDFRDDPDPRITLCTLPEDVAAWCLRAARALELTWTGIDLRRTPDGRHVFLEANPSPMFLGFEARAGLPLTDALVALLLEPP